MLHRFGPLLAGSQRPPVVVDLGYGAHPVTTLELRQRLATVRADVQVVGLEIDQERVSAATPHATPPALTFALGGFEIPLPGGSPAHLVRAFNVLRQYDEEQVLPAWSRVVSRLAPGGALVEGTCNELGRLGSWVDVRRGDDGLPLPRSLTLSWRLADVERPSVVAERLPKALIHRNVPGEPIHAFLTELDRAWAHSAAQSSWGARQRFRATMEGMYAAGWPLLDGPSRWRLGEVSVAWSAVAPGGPAREHDGSDHQGP